MLGLGNILTKGGALLGFPNKYSFNFDGSNDYLENASPTGLPSGDTFTISAWIKVNASHIGTSHFPIFRRDEATNNLAFTISNGTPKIALILYNIETKKGNTTISDDTWHHVAVSVNNLEATFYLNGFADGTQTFSGSFVHENELNIGMFSNGNNIADGNIDEVAVWNTALSASDVAKIASKPVDFSKASTYATDRTANLKLWLRAGDKVLPESDTSIARSDFYTDFDGTDDYVSVTTSGHQTTKGTISGWFYPVLGGEQALFSVGTASVGKIRSLFLNGANLKFIGYGADWDTNVDIVTNTWYHLALTWDGNNVVVYVNGVAYPNSSLTLNTPDGTELKIGTATWTDNYYSDGAISNLSLYKTALDAQTIKQFAKSRYTPMRDNRFSVVDFDGVNDYIDCGNDSSLELAGDMTITAWINPTGADSSQGIVTKRDGGGTNYYFALDSSTPPKLTFYDGSVSGTSTGTITKDSWQHIAISIDSGVTNGSIFYINGIASGTATLNITANDAPLVIGRRVSDNYYEGSISSASVYSTAKSAEEIYAQYQKGITHNPSADTGLVGLWRMGDDTSASYPTIADSSSNSNDGTASGAVEAQQMISGYDMGAFESSSEELSGELLGDPSFTVDNTDNITGTGTDANVTGGALVFVDPEAPATGQTDIIFKNSGENILVSGRIYKHIFTIADASGSGARLKFDWITGHDHTNYTDGTHTIYGLADQASADMDISGASPSFKMTEFSIKEVLQSEVSDTNPTIIDVTEPVLGVELIENGVISTNQFTLNPAYDAGTGKGVTIDNGTLRIRTTGNTAVYIEDDNLFESGALYKIVAVVSDATAGDLYFRGGNVYVNNQASTVGTHIIYLKSDGTNFIIARDDSTVDISINSLSVKKVFGNVGTMTNFDNANSGDIMYGSVLPDQSFLTGVNSAYSFIDLDGTDAFIDLPDDIVPNTSIESNGITLSAWINIDTTGSRKAIVGQADNQHDDFTSGGLYIDSSNRLEFMIFKNSSYNATVSSTTFSTGVWHHVLATYSGESSDDKVRIYVDGSLETTSSALGGDMLGGTNNNNFIGKNCHSSDTNYFNGQISSVSIFNKQLSDIEISAIYTAGRHTNLLDSYSDNLKGYYAFGALDAITGLPDTDSTIYDRSGNSNHGTPSGTATGDLKSPPNAEPNGYAKGDTNRSTTTP